MYIARPTSVVAPVFSRLPLYLCDELQPSQSVPRSSVKCILWPFQQSTVTVLKSELQSCKSNLLNFFFSSKDGSPSTLSTSDCSAELLQLQMWEVYSAPSMSSFRECKVPRSPSYGLEIMFFAAWNQIHNIFKRNPNNYLKFTFTNIQCIFFS